MKSQQNPLKSLKSSEVKLRTAADLWRDAIGSRLGYVTRKNDVFFGELQTNVETIINHPWEWFLYLYHPFMAVWGMVHYCFTHIIYSYLAPQRVMRGIIAPV
jgi:hypothetical protein